MIYIRALFSILAGFVVMSVLVILGTLLATILFASDNTYALGSAYLAMNIVLSFAAAVVGGYVCTWIAQQEGVVAGCVLAGTILIFGILTALGLGSPDDAQPGWYLWLMPFVGAAGVLAGMTRRALRRAAPPDTQGVN